MVERIVVGGGGLRRGRVAPGLILARMMAPQCLIAETARQFVAGVEKVNLCIDHVYLCRLLSCSGLSCTLLTRDRLVGGTVAGLVHLMEFFSKSQLSLSQIFELVRIERFLDMGGSLENVKLVPGSKLMSTGVFALVMSRLCLKNCVDEVLRLWGEEEICSNLDWGLGRCFTWKELKGLFGKREFEMWVEESRIKEKDWFYCTTAISYTNGSPHMGHTYEILVADTLKRYEKMSNGCKKVFLLTGTDEHGQKIAAAAAKHGMEAQHFCDMYAKEFKDLYGRLNVDEDRFIRTTESEHKKCAQDLWRAADKKGCLYLEDYTGWYWEREERFLTELEAKEMNYIDVSLNKPLVKMSEETYHFRLSDYNDYITSLLSIPGFVYPNSRREELLNRVKREGLQDLCCSRTNFTWGIKVPNDSKHVMYVWFDALSNYYTGSFVKGESLWPADVHVVGKDILWFHAVIWPSILKSADLKPPKRILAHGFVTAGDGVKMSKSLGNVILPDSALDMFGVDGLRYLLLKNTTMNLLDVKYDEESYRAIYNADLADQVGNLLCRVGGLCERLFGGCVPVLDSNVEMDGLGVYNLGRVGEVFARPVSFVDMIGSYLSMMELYDFRGAIGVILNGFRNTNKYMTECEPWGKICVTPGLVVRVVIESLVVCLHLLEPFCPMACELAFKGLCVSKKSLDRLSLGYDNAVSGAVLDLSVPLFPRLR